MCALFLSLSEDTVKNSTIYHARTHTHTQREREKANLSLRLLLLLLPETLSNDRSIEMRFFMESSFFLSKLDKKALPCFFFVGIFRVIL